MHEVKKILSYLCKPDFVAKALFQQYSRYKRIKNDKEYWISIRNKHYGQAGIVVGNGPSLQIEDLTKISKKKIVTIASNKIYLAFAHTDWRPDYYTVADPLVWEKVKNNIHDDIKVVYIPDYLDPADCIQTVKTWKSLKNNFQENLTNISNDISQGAKAGYTITYENIQLAIHLGLNPIYLIGCDHFYEGETKVDKDVKIVQTSDKTHFINNYREIGEVVYPAPIEIMTKAYKIAKLYSDKTDTKILNATRGGYLEVFEKINLDKVLSNE